jgi:quinoprotein glucose dehydrogenase
VFTLDRETGEPVFPVDERPVPQDGVEGEKLSPTQPFPVAPAPLTPHRIIPNYAFGLTPFDRGACRRRIAEARNDGIFTPPSTQGTIVLPSTAGGTNWGGAAFDPTRNRLYVNTMSLLHIVTLIPRNGGEPDPARHRDVEFGAMRGAPYALTREARVVGPFGVPCNPPPWGQLHAIDMDSGVVAWNATLGTTEDLAPLGVAIKWGTPNLGAPIAVGGGLIFIGAAMDRYLRAFDSDTGRELWQGRLPAGGQATPMSYEWEGRQYVVIAAGGHGNLGTMQGDYVIAFALPRDGEEGPSIRSYTIDRPGGRFMLGAALVGMVIALLLVLRLAGRRSE